MSGVDSLGLELLIDRTCVGEDESEPCYKTNTHSNNNNNNNNNK